MTDTKTRTSRSAISWRPTDRVRNLFKDLNLTMTLQGSEIIDLAIERLANEVGRELRNRTENVEGTAGATETSSAGDTTSSGIITTP